MSSLGHQNIPPHRPGKRAWYIKGAIVIVGLGVVVAAHPVWLSQAARFLVIEETLRPADIIVVFGGYVGMKHAAGLYHQGYSSRLLIPFRPTREWIFGFIPDPVSLIREQAESLGVPVEHLILHRTPRRQLPEAWAQGIKAALHPQSVTSAIVVGRPFQMRRLALLFDKVFSDAGVKLTYSPAPPEAEELSIHNWWTKRDGLITVQNEYLLLLLRVLQYRVGILRERVVEQE